MALLYFGRRDADFTIIFFQKYNPAQHAFLWCYFAESSRIDADVFGKGEEEKEKIVERNFLYLCAYSDNNANEKITYYVFLKNYSE